MDFIIRRAIAADWPSVRRIHERSVRHELYPMSAIDRPSIAATEDVFRGDLWIAEAKDQALGFVASAGAVISWLYVDPQRFRRGIGRALLRYAAAQCGAIANADVLAGNAACMALMESEGFALAEKQVVMIAGYGEVDVRRMRRVRLVTDRSPVVGARQMADYKERHNEHAQGYVGDSPPSLNAAAQIG